MGASGSTVADLAGASRVAVLLAAFVANTWKLVGTESAGYQAANAAGAALTCAAAIAIPFVPFIVLEGMWMVASIVSIARLNRRRHHARQG
jgi:hypothetical protein